MDLSIRMEQAPKYDTPHTLLDKALADDPIHLPRSPFWDIFKTFGRDELIALGINTAATFGIDSVSDNQLLLATSGPIVEKAGFFVAYGKEAHDIYATTPDTDREPKAHYVKSAIIAGLPSLVKDVLIHDPLYTAGMYAGLTEYPQTPAVLLSAITFIAAVGAIAGGEVAANEVAYKKRLHNLKKKGFTIDPLLEARFVLRDDDPDRVLGEIANEFSLGDIQTDRYHDWYYDTSLPSYNTRVPDLRLRERTGLNDGVSHQAAQVVFTRVNKVNGDTPSQFNYFPTEKDKLRKQLDSIPRNMGELQQAGLSKLMYENHVGKEVIFTRSYAHSVGRLHVSTDLVVSDSSTPFSVVEIKTDRKKASIKELIKVMRHIMQTYDVVQTTHNKRQMATMHSSS